MAGRTRISDGGRLRLDLTAAKPSRRERWTAVVVAAVICLALGGWLLASASGLFRPHLNTANGWSAQTSPEHHTISQTLTVTNESWLDARVTGVASYWSALRVTGVDGLPVTVGGGGQATVTVHYRITDCAELTDAAAGHTPTRSLRAEVSRWWGAVTVPLAGAPRTIAASVCRNANAPG